MGERGRELTKAKRARFTASDGWSDFATGSADWADGQGSRLGISADSQLGADQRHANAIDMGEAVDLHGIDTWLQR